MAKKSYRIGRDRLPEELSNKNIFEVTLAVARQAKMLSSIASLQGKQLENKAIVMSFEDLKENKIKYYFKKEDDKKKEEEKKEEEKENKE